MEVIDSIEQMLTTQLERVKHDLTLGKQTRNVQRSKIVKFI